MTKLIVKSMDRAIAKIPDDELKRNAVWLLVKYGPLWLRLIVLGLPLLWLFSLIYLIISWD